jgi:chromosome segregation ATPase
MQLNQRMTAAHAQLQEDLNRIQASLESHQRGMEEAKEAHAKATDALAEMRAAKIADDSVLAQVKEQLAQKEQLISRAMTDLQATAQIEEKLRAREEEIEKVRAEHQQELVTLREQSSGTDEAIKAKHHEEIQVSRSDWHI